MSYVIILGALRHVPVVQFLVSPLYMDPFALTPSILLLCQPSGFHWLTASFWLVSQQPDICTGPWCWRAFNGVMGLVHVFLFLNVKDGPSRFRMATFYAVGNDLKL